MKKLVLLFPLLVIFFACSSSIDTTNLGPEERLATAIKMYDEEDYEESLKELETLLLQFPGSSIVDDAQYYLGMCRFQRSEYILGAYEFSKLIKGMPTSEYVAQSQFMLAECYYELSPVFTLDQRYSKKAIEEYQAFIDFFPLNERVAEAEQKILELNTKLAKKEYETAKIYEKLDYSTAAIKYYDNVLEVYHDTDYAPLALYNKINLLLSKDREDEALQSATMFLERYPLHPNSGDVEKIKSSLELKISASN